MAVGRQNLALFSTPSHIVRSYSFARRQIFRKQMTFCQSTMFWLPNDTKLNNFHREMFAVWCLTRVTFTVLTMSAAQRTEQQAVTSAE